MSQERKADMTNDAEMPETEEEEETSFWFNQTEAIADFSHYYYFIVDYWGESQIWVG